MNAVEQQIHEAAVKIATQYKKTEIELILILQKVERTKLYRKLDCANLFQYTTRTLGLSESAAYMFNVVSKKSAQIKTLQNAVESGTISIAKASRIISVIDKENASELILFSQGHSFREIYFKVAKLAPRSSARERVKILSEDTVEITVTISKSAYEDLKRIQDLKAPVNMGQALELAVKQYVKRKDPVQKAARAKSKPLWHRGKNRTPLNSEQKHAVFARDEGRCTHVNDKGIRCNSDRWIQIHHIRPVVQGGSNDPNNLTTLCSFHHDLVHQLSLPLDEQVTWLRSPLVSYAIN